MARRALPSWVASASQRIVSSGPDSFHCHSAYERHASLGVWRSFSSNPVSSPPSSSNQGPTQTQSSAPTPPPSSSNQAQTSIPTPPPPPPPPSYAATDYSSYQQTSVRRRPYNLEAKMRMKQYRREAMHRQQALAIEEEERNFQLDQSKLYQKGDPGTVQGIVKEIITVGYFMKLPDGREGLLPCMELGCTGGIPLLTRLFKVGDEITVRQQKMYDGGKDKLFAKKDST
ncbi:hypothetical protein KP509_01G110000 [Ceratopteris richardii]|nr:hypothetical protein KP509_01G110000 [Ceratopteris richardii]